MHAIGDRAVRNSLDAVRRPARRTGSDARHHIAHMQIVQPEDVPRFAELDVVANCQPYWAQRIRRWRSSPCHSLDRERSDMQYPSDRFSAAERGWPVGSDWSVTTANPLEEIEVMVNRVDPENRDNAPFLPEERVSLADAIAAFTSGTAYINHDEHDSGRLAQGMRADLAVLNRNIFESSSGPDRRSAGRTHVRRGPRTSTMRVFPDLGFATESRNRSR